MAKLNKEVKFPALISDANLLAKEGKLIASAVGKLDDRIQNYLVSELAHIAQHHNPTRLNEFFASLKGKGARITAMSAYVQHFGTIELDEKGQKFIDVKSKKFNLEETRAAHWTTFKPEGKLVAFSLNAQVKSLIEKALALSVNAPEGKEVNIPETTMKALLELAAANNIEIETPKVKEVKAEGKVEQVA